MGGMASRFEPTPTLDAQIAQRIMRPAVDTALDRMRDLARAHAPVVDVWITARDERVRPSHAATDGQGVPANLRFKVPKVNFPDDYDLARYPRDPDLPANNRHGCRCQTVTVPDGLSRTIHRTPATVEGNRVFGQVYTRFKRAAESEFGAHGDEGAHFMRHALQETALSLPGTRQR